MDSGRTWIVAALLALGASATVACGGGSSGQGNLPGWDETGNAPVKHGDGADAGSPSTAPTDPGMPGSGDDAGAGGSSGGGADVDGGGGAGGGGGTGTGGGGTATQTTVKVDGVEMTVSKTTVWAPNANGTSHVFIDFSGGSVQSGTDVDIELSAATSGCVDSPSPTPNDVWYRPAGTDQFLSSNGTSCGLTITSLPVNVGDSAAGTFHGSVHGINGANGTSHQLDIAFGVVRKN